MVHDIRLNSDRGVGPFVTLRHLYSRGGHSVWLARNHRKGLGVAQAPRPFWQWPVFNGAMAVGFAVGAALFAIGAVLSLAPSLATGLSLTEREVNIVFFVGSIVFTLAAFLQVFQSANAGADTESADTLAVKSLLGWRPKDPGWLSSSTQFGGTLLFNASTYDAIGGGNWLRQDVLVWGPDILGSMLFLFSGYLALVETCHGWWSWRPRTLAWWVVMVNFLGCVAFMISAIFSFVPQSGLPAYIGDASTLFTFAGAACFITGALLSLREAVTEPDRQ